MNLDGGGSATLWAFGMVKNSPSEGDERPAPNALVLLKKANPETVMLMKTPQNRASAIAAEVGRCTHARRLAAPPALLAVEFRSAQTLPGAELFDKWRGPAASHRDGALGPWRACGGIRASSSRATVKEEAIVYEDVAIHLKGSIGSFRDVDDKPDLTLDFNRFNARQKFHGLRRIHLNNSVEDPSYCNELLGSELFRAAGIPAPRVAHAVVTLNGRRLGLYVLKEGFTEDFLGCYFKQVGGNLYEPGEGHDVNQRLKRNSVQAPKQDRTALEAVGGRGPGGRPG